MFKKHKFSKLEMGIFARISGDFNPAHTDSLYARRTMWGETVVHGINQILYMLDTFFSELNKHYKLMSLNCEFLSSLGVNQGFYIDVVETEKVLILLKSVNGEVLTKLDFKYCEIVSQKDTTIDCDFIMRLPENPDEVDLINFSYKEKLLVDKQILQEAYALHNKIPMQQIALLTACTRVVGMRCPGLNSIFSSLYLEFSQDGKFMEEINFSVFKFHDVFKRVTIDVSGKGVSGQINAFLRPEPCKQASLEELKKNVREDQFKEERALIVGGSRGIGEVIAKLLALGGADVIITYNSGKEEAHRLANSLTNEGYKINSVHLNVLEENYSCANNFSSLFYCASPFIFSGVKDQFCIERFNKFSNYYVKGFVNLVQKLYPAGLRKVFYPSTIAIEDKVNGMWEYSASKSAAEHVCELLEKRYKGLKIYKPRFPRISTDQTRTVMPVESLAPQEVLIEFLHEFQSI